MPEVRSQKLEVRSQGNRGLWTMDYGPSTADYGLWTVD